MSNLKMDVGPVGGLLYFFSSQRKFHGAPVIVPKVHCSQEDFCIYSYKRSFKRRNRSSDTVANHPLEQGN